MTATRKKLSPWPFVTLILGGGAIFAAIVIFTPEGPAKTALLGAEGLLFTLVAWLARSPRDHWLIASLVERLTQAESLRPPPPAEVDTAPETPRSKRGGFVRVETLLLGSLGMALSMLAWLLVTWALSGCGASDAVRARYSVEVAHCIANERAIVDRVGTTAEQDYEDLDAERARCDAALRLIEGGE